MPHLPTPNLLERSLEGTRAAATDPVRRTRVLLVDDSDEDARYLTLLLKRPFPEGRFEVFRAASFAEGLQKANELAVDVGLFDQNLGDGTGLELLGALRSMGSDIPVILLTGMDSSALDAAALRAGAADYLPKADLTPWLLERSIRYAREQAATLSELRKTNRLLDAMVTRLPVAVVRIDSDGTVLESRGRGWESLGFRPGEMVGRRLQEEMPDCAAGLNHALEGAEVSFTGSVQRRGAWHHFDHHFQFDAERGRGAIGFAVNVTARVEAESERVRQAQLLRSLLKNLPVVAGRIGADGRVTEVQGASLIVGLPRAEAWLGKLFAEVIPQAKPFVEAVLRGGTAQFSVTAGGSDRSMTAEFSLSHDEEARHGAIFFGRDVTERRRLEQQLLSASDEEQQRIGADLHDGLGQQLTGLACLAAALHERLRRSSPAEALQAGQISRLANDAIEQARALARGLCPVQLEHLGLCSALEDLAYQAQHLHQVVCRFVLRGPAPRQDALVDKHLYRIAQEAIHNAVRHGGARSIRLRLISHARAHRLVITDDGCGFEVGRPARSDSRGLRLMQQRATVISAALGVKSKPGAGTRIAVTWTPWPDSSHESTH